MAILALDKRLIFPCRAHTEAQAGPAFWDRAYTGVGQKFLGSGHKAYMGAPAAVASGRAPRQGLPAVQREPAVREIGLH